MSHMLPLRDYRPPIVVNLDNAFMPDGNRQIVPLDRSMTIREYLDGEGIVEFDRPTICLHNGAPVLRKNWSEMEIRAGDICTFVALPHGGGGGGGGSNPLQIVLQVVVLIASIYTGGLVGAMYGSFYGALAAAAVNVAGSMLINALVPFKPNSANTNFNGGMSTQRSPTYSLQAQGNSARVGEPIPVIYGRHRVYPDLAATPYQEYVSDDQYLFQLHCIGQGHFDVEKIGIEDTDITNFAEVTTEIVPPGSSVTIFDPNVISAAEVSGQELLGTNESGYGYVGPFVCNPANTQATDIGIDIVLPRGLYYSNDSGGLDNRTASWDVEAREIDASGAPVGAGTWTVLGSESITTATVNPIRNSYKYSVTAGRYEVRVKRTNTKDLSSRSGNDVQWVQLRGYLNLNPDFSDVTLLAVKMRATNNLSQQSSRLINCIVTRKLPIWDSVTETWSAPTATRSIVWAFCDAARAEYGAALPDGRLPLAQLEALNTTLEARGDYFDGVFDSQTTVWDAFQKIARCGRAVPIMQGGSVRMIRDSQQSLPVAMFGPRNIVKGSLKIDYIMPGEDTADSVEVEFFNNATWELDYATGAVDDSAEEKPAKVRIFGITDAAHAQREADYMAYDNRYRRKFVKFRTELEGMIPTYGDLIAVTHDMPRWGQGAELSDWTADDVESGAPYSNAILTLTEPPQFVDGETHYIALRELNGSLKGPFQCQAVVDQPNQVQLLEDLTFTPYVGSSKERTYSTFGPTDKWTQYCRVLSIKPRQGGEQVEISAVAEDNRVHVN